METKFNFKSQFCTSRFQSEHLLSLGLKKETADMVHFFSQSLAQDWTIVPLSDGETARYIQGLEIPAWSLGRLIKLMPRTAIIHTQEGDTRIDIDMYAIEILVSDDPIAEAVSVIEWLIKEGNFPKEYLEE